MPPLLFDKYYCLKPRPETDIKCSADRGDDARPWILNGPEGEIMSISKIVYPGFNVVVLYSQACRPVHDCVGGYYTYFRIGAFDSSIVSI